MQLILLNAVIQTLYKKMYFFINKGDFPKYGNPIFLKNISSIAEKISSTSDCQSMLIDY